jgi:D-alanine-D-alanine ligase
MARVGLAYNTIPIDYLKRFPLDTIAEYDTQGTVQAVAAALETRGHEVIPLEADVDFVNRLQAARVDIVFNIAEGLRGESRESHVPSVCELMRVPYTGSGVLTTALCLDKAVTNRLLRDSGLPIPPFQVFQRGDEALEDGLAFPLIVKLLHEGSSMGLTAHSVVEDEAGLRQQARAVVEAYHEPVLVQNFIAGREFTTGVLGNQDAVILPPVEVVFDDPLGIVTFELDEDMLPLLEQAGAQITPETPRAATSGHQTVCPARISQPLYQQIKATVLRAYRAAGCRDWCRVDTRLGADGVLYVLDLNPIAGITPGYWLPRAAASAGMDYAAFVNRILDLAMERYRGNGRG